MEGRMLGGSCGISSVGLSPWLGETGVLQPTQPRHWQDGGTSRSGDRSPLARGDGTTGADEITCSSWLIWRVLLFFGFFFCCKRPRQRSCQEASDIY